MIAPVGWASVSLSGSCNERSRSLIRQWFRIGAGMIDDLDRRILGALQKNNRLSFSELADRKSVV
nr:AsnC family transcriptional regulator [Mesorhizobium sp. L2C054A000]